MDNLPKGISKRGDKFRVSFMQWMGHKSIEQTQRYAHFMPGKLDDAAAALDTLATVK